ncbi:mandelate racemase/muconate lactonizing enzyme family protein [Dactylosporangium sp. CA-233914]|uniref:mandelate racemase/muconate lactonizing enzyme family protein n=1 Tax=Dactylosporangium sp. CA-233914 TaxID=3239934 RepID=UPI003D8AFC5F
MPLRIPRLTPMVATQGNIDSSEFGVVRVETDAGITGWGEIAMSWGRLGRALCRDVELSIAPTILGLDPRDVAGCAVAVEQRLDLATDGAHAARAGVEMALLDILGKALDTPVYRLLGGRARERVPVAWPIPWGDVEATVAQARTAVEAGFRTVKLKVGRPGSIDREAVSAVRRAVGAEVSIKVDANMAYRSAGAAYAALAPLEEHGLQLIEQPLRPQDLDELARLRSRLATPLLLDESCWHLRDVGEIVRRGAADVLNVYVTEMGGPLQAWKAFAAAEAAGLVALLGSQCELGLATAACAHVGVAVANLGYESDVVGPLRYPRDIVRNPPVIKDGYLHVPEGPGLGVEIDLGQVEALRCG